MAEAAAASDSVPAPRASRWPGRRTVLWACLSGAVVALGLEVFHVLIGQNFHTVLAGRVYRCAQLSEGVLEKKLRRYGIRTVVNLRGCCDPYSWYLDECRTTHRLDVAQEDVCLSACRLPSASEIRHLVEVLDRTEYPILMHCRRGSDRTGLVSTLVQLLFSDMDLAQARHQLGLRFGHVAVGKTRYCDHFFELYAEWLQEHGAAHSRTAFRRWLEHEYCPGECRCVLTPLELPRQVPVGQPWAIRVRAQNTSTRTWRFRPGTNAGIHAAYSLADSSARCLVAGRAALFDAEIAPGQSVDLTLSMPSLEAPGPYSLLVDMVDEQQCWFFQTGSEPLQDVVVAAETTPPRRSASNGAAAERR